MNLTRRKIGEIDPKKKVTSETKYLCDLILVMVRHAQVYMRNVDSFAWHGKHNEQQIFVSLSIEYQKDLRPLNVYIGQLQEHLHEADDNYQAFCGVSSSTKKTLDRLLNELKQKENDAQASEDNTNLVGGLGVLGAIGSATFAGLGIIATGGIGAAVLLAGVASAMSAGVAGVAYIVAAEFKDKKDAYVKLAAHTKTIQANASKMQEVVTEINRSLEDIGTKVDTIYETSLLTGLKRLFSKMAELGKISSECCRQLESLENDLKRSVNQLEVETRQR